MKILVPISKVPDTTAKVSFTDGDSKFNEDGIQWIVNPYDEWYALVRALEITEKDGGTVTVINVGPATADAVIRKALALGAHEAVRVDTDPTESYVVAKQIAEYAKDKNFDLILPGKETIDYNGSEVGGMIAEFLGLPFLSLISKLDVNGDTLTLERSTEAGTEVVEAKLPLVVSASKGMAEQRIPNMRGIMAARSKPLTVIPPVDVEAKTAYVKYGLPPEKASVRLVDPENMDELVNLLHTEAKVI
ncbi:MAG: electron transfer flavoprotein subunit beta/FixA family protein [Flavobacteriales bacterium]|nr:electron transfer flavoprotein subunit beta/FixA family protein [Flavobacteriales bacterium]